MGKVVWVAMVNDCERTGHGEVMWGRLAELGVSPSLLAVFRLVLLLTNTTTLPDPLVLVPQRGTPDRQGAELCPFERGDIDAVVEIAPGSSERDHLRRGAAGASPLVGEPLGDRAAWVSCRVRVCDRMTSMSPWPSQLTFVQRSP